MKRGLAIISAPQYLLQSLWFCSEHPDCRFDACISTAHLSNETQKHLIRQCAECGCFNRVTSTEGYKGRKAVEKAMLFFRMAVSFALGRRGRLTSEIINSVVQGAKYDVVLADTEFSVIGGAFIDHSDYDYDVVIMQDGFADLMKREDLPRFSISEFIYWLTSKMGYCNPATRYKLKKVKYCSKINTFGSMLKYKPYKQILNIDYGNQNPRFQAYAERTYGISMPKQIDADVIFMTTDFAALGVKENTLKKIREWLHREYKGEKIALKKHPRDSYLYDWEEIAFCEIDTSIPAELLLPVLRGKTVINTYASSVLADFIEQGIDYKVVYFKEISVPEFRYDFEQIIDILQIPNDRIIVID